MSVNLNLLSQIEKAVVAEINAVVLTPKRRPMASGSRNRGGQLEAIGRPPLAEELSPNRFLVERSDSKFANMPSVNVAITSGETSPLDMSRQKMTINIEILVVATNPHSEPARRDELYPVLTAIVCLLSGKELKDEKGKTLPIDNIYPTGKFGQVSQQGEQLTYALKFKTAFCFPNFRDESGEEIRGFFTNYYVGEGNNPERSMDGDRICIVADA